jgi:proteasome accessory factor A
MGIETEYAVVYFPARGEGTRPTNLALYPLFEEYLATRVKSLPRALSLLRAKPGRFLENGMSFHYEGTPRAFEHGLLEIASPECRDPFSLLHYEAAKDALAEELREDVNQELARRGWRGEVRLLKSNVDSQGHTFGSHESYWIDDPLPVAQRLLIAPLWALCWLLTLPALAWLVLVSLLVAGAPLLLLLAPLAGLGLLGLARLIARFSSSWAARWRRAGQGLQTLPMRVAARLQSDPALLMRKLAWVEWPLRPMMPLHTALYQRFYFRAAVEGSAAFLVTRALYAGAGSIVWGRSPLLHVSQRAPYLRVLSAIFTHGDRRPLVEVRDLFFRPWSAFGRRRRLHLMLGDANLCDWSQVLRTGATALVLEAIEAQPDAGWPVLVDPLGALRALSANPGTPLRLRGGGEATALEIQQAVLDRVREVLGAPDLAWKRRILDMWQETLTLLDRDPDGLVDRVDWIAKRSLLRRDVPSRDDWPVLAREGARLVSAGDAGGEEGRLRGLAFRMLRTDHRYHELGPRGGHRRLRERGAIRELCDSEAVLRARHEPPADTRAHARGAAIREAFHRSLGGAATWHRVRLGLLDWRWLRDPLSVADRSARGR